MRRAFGAGRSGAATLTVGLAVPAVWLCAWFIGSVPIAPQGAPIWAPAGAVALAVLIRIGPIGLPLLLTGLPFLAIPDPGPGLPAAALLPEAAALAAYLPAALAYRRRAGTRPLLRPENHLSLLACAASGAVLAAAAQPLFDLTGSNVTPREAAGAATQLLAAHLLAHAVLLPWLVFVVRRPRGPQWVRLVPDTAGALAAAAGVLGAAVAIGVDVRGLVSLTVAATMVFVAAQRPPRHALSVLASTLGALVLSAQLLPAPIGGTEITLLALMIAAFAQLTLGRSLLLRRQGIQLRTLRRGLERSTDRNAKATEELARIQTRLGELAHELRTPLNAISGFSELIGLQAGTRGDRGLQSQADAIHESATFLEVLIGDLIDASSLRAGAFTARIDDVDVGQVAASVERMLAPRARSRDQTLILDRPAGQLIARADGTRLKQVLTNLVANAIKYSPPGATVRLAVQGLGGGARIEVADDGPGLSEAQLQAARTPYRRLPGSEQTEGSGIGLPLALRLIEEMGGRVQIDSAPGAGTRFRIDLPAHPTASLSRGAR